MDRDIEFIVKGITEGVSGQLRVIGRCSEDSIHIGDVFDSLYHVDETEVSGSERPPARRDAKRLKLCVRGIHAYEHDLAELSPGMTGSLDLEGAGRELVEPGWLLGVIPVAVIRDGPTIPDSSHSSNLARG